MSKKLLEWKRHMWNPQWFANGSRNRKKKWNFFRISFNVISFLSFQASKSGVDYSSSARLDHFVENFFALLWARLPLRVWRKSNSESHRLHLQNVSNQERRLQSLSLFTVWIAVKIVEQIDFQKVFA